MLVEYIKMLKKCISGMIIADFKRNAVHPNGYVKKMNERLTENTIVVKKILKIKIYLF